MREPLKLNTPQLTPDLKALCNRVASERGKPWVWSEGKRLRQFCQQRLSEGESVVHVTNWLAQELTAAVAAQRSG